MQLNSIVNDIRKIKGVKVILQFGSSIKGTARPYSDVDICVITAKDVSKDTWAEILSYSSKKLDVSLFWDLPVNMRYRVLKEGKVLFNKDEGWTNRIINEAIRHYLDFKPTIERHLAAVGV
ncbi:MAG: nucleotidyltransferase domain-containing protein [DPANN group archaeon]|nr:nucleotidyltransferase domain-containing protein [DPANN group archaeon]